MGSFVFGILWGDVGWVIFWVGILWGDVGWVIFWVGILWELFSGRGKSYLLRSRSISSSTSCEFDAISESVLSISGCVAFSDQVDFSAAGA